MAVEELMLVNPRRRRRRRSVAGRPRDRWGRFLPMDGRRRRRNPIAAANPRRRRRYRRRNPDLALVAANPRRRRVYRRRRNPGELALAANPRRRYYRRNPDGMISKTVMPAAMGAAGALGLDIALGVIPLPESLKTAPISYLVKGAGAIGLGIVAGMFVHARTAQQLAVGALTVVLHDAMRTTLQSAMPSIPFGITDDELTGLGYVNPALIQNQGMSAYLEPAEMSAYVEPPAAEMSRLY